MSHIIVYVVVVIFAVLNGLMIVLAFCHNFFGEPLMYEYDTDDVQCTRCPVHCCQEAAGSR